MITCEYKISVAKAEKPFEDGGTNKFKTTTELEAFRIIKIWNDRSGVNSTVIWRYDAISFTDATSEDIDNPDIPFHKSDNC